MSEAYILRVFRKFQDAGTVKMAQFFIINGITDPGLHHQIAQYAFLEGVESCDLYEYLHGAFHKEMEPLFFCVDQDGFRNLPEQLINILYMRCQLVAVPGCREEAEDLRRKEKYGCALMKMPFSRQDFRRMCIQYAGVKKWEDRIMRFENLTIDRSSRQVRLDGKCVEMGAYDYDILLLLAEHMGDVEICSAGRFQGEEESPRGTLIPTSKACGNVLEEKNVYSASVLWGTAFLKKTCCSRKPESFFYENWKKALG